MHVLKVKNLNLEATIESGQLFRWWKQDNMYYIGLRNVLLKLRQDGDVLYWDGIRLDGNRLSEDIIVHFFRLDEDYEEILESISVDEHMKKVIRQFYGLRILRQDPWECLISFLSTMVSNIPKHSGQLKKLCENYGKIITLGDFSTFTFPEPGSLPSENALRKFGFGFRAPYLVFANTLVTDKNLVGFSSLCYSDVKTSLMKFYGVGSKIADCVALFSLEQVESFPVDVWIKRAVEEIYFSEVQKERIIEEFGQSYFGRYAGYAQQFLYHWRRSSK